MHLKIDERSLRVLKTSIFFSKMFKKKVISETSLTLVQSHMSILVLVVNLTINSENLYLISGLSVFVMQANISKGQFSSAKPGTHPGQGSSDHPSCWSLDPLSYGVLCLALSKTIYCSGNLSPLGLIPKATREDAK